jgi:23S rRNA pseudouridine1911/1915/1917 synthase
MKLEPKTKRPITLVTRLEHKSSQTLLEYLAKRFPYHSPDEWRERIQEGKIQVNGLTPSEGQPLRAGDEVAYTTQAWEEPEVNPHYRVVFEDDSLLALSKPAPLPVHAIGAYFENTLMHLLRRDRPEAQNYHLVHRLDSETSGLLLLVKDKNHLKNLQNQWKQPHSFINKPSPLEGEGRVRGADSVIKIYRAIVFGKFEPGVRRVDLPIGPLKGSRIRMKLGVNQENSRPSITDLECLEVKHAPRSLGAGGGNYSLLEAKPLTGRTHQIRVHLENTGHPIVGDKLYSGDEETFLHFMDEGWDEWLKEKVLLPRQALHAFRLEFNHPVTGERMALEDPLPTDLADFWKNI